jgi:hypothetical protein
MAHCLDGRLEKNYCAMLLATPENTLLALPPIRRTVPITKTRITASMTAYSAISCPCSSLQTLLTNCIIDSSGPGGVHFREFVYVIMTTPRTIVNLGMSQFFHRLRFLLRPETEPWIRDVRVNHNRRAGEGKLLKATAAGRNRTRLEEARHRRQAGGRTGSRNRARVPAPLQDIA